MLVASAMRRPPSSLNSVLNFLAFFFPIGLSHYGRYVSPISSRPPCLTFGVHYIYLERSDGTQAHKLASVGDFVRDIAWSPEGDEIRFTMKDRIFEMLPNGSNLQQLIPGW